MKFIIDIVKMIKRKRREREYVRDRFSEPLFPRLINPETEEKIFTSRDTRVFVEMANREFFTQSELINNEMNYCVDFDNAISSCSQEILMKFIEKVIPDMQEELGIAFYGISPVNRDLLLNAMPKRRAELIVDNMLFFEKELYRSNCKENINKACKMMLDILSGKEVIEEFKIDDFVIACIDDPVIQFEHFIIDAPESEIRRVLVLIDNADLSVASYYLSENEKERLFGIVGEELTKLIKEDHSFMDSPSRKDVRQSCERIIDKVDVYWTK